MKRLRIFSFFLLTILIMLASVQTSFSKERTITLNVPGITWSASAKRVSSALKEVEGVISADAQVETKAATVTFDDSKTNMEKLKEVLMDKGFAVK